MLSDGIEELLDLLDRGQKIPLSWVTKWESTWEAWCSCSNPDALYQLLSRFSRYGDYEGDIELAWEKAEKLKAPKDTKYALIERETPEGSYLISASSNTIERYVEMDIAGEYHWWENKHEVDRLLLEPWRAIVFKHFVPAPPGLSYFIGEKWKR